MVARYVVPEVNRLLNDYRESNQFVIEDRDALERAGEAVASKIRENERAVAADMTQRLMLVGLVRGDTHAPLSFLMCNLADG